MPFGCIARRWVRQDEVVLPVAEGYESSTAYVALPKCRNRPGHHHENTLQHTFLQLPTAEIVLSEA